MPPQLPSSNDGERVNNSDYITRLRDRAERHLAPSATFFDELSAKEIKHLAQELQIHQIELEMQNESLRETQMHLERARDEYARLYHEAPVGYATLDIDNNILKANKTLARMLNTELELLSGRFFFDFVARDKRDDFYLFQRQHQQGREVSTHLEILLTPQGERAEAFDAELRASWQVVENEQERQEVMHLTISDITARKRQEKVLIQAQKLESLGLMAGGMAHIVNNMLASVVLNIELAQRRLDTEHPVYPQLVQMQKHIDAELHTFKQLLDYTGNQQREHTAVDMNQLILGSQSLFRAASQHAHALISLDLQRAPHTDCPPLVYGNTSQLQQVLINLVSNAAEAYSVGYPEATIVIQTYFENDHTICVSVTDFGEGIAAENVERIFDPFFTTKFFGRGLGLAATAGIVKSHRGYMRVKTARHEGTTVQVYLPAHLSSETFTPEAISSDQQTESVSATEERVLMGDNYVLIIDDEVELTNIIAEVLSFSGYQTLVCNNGLDGVEAFKRSHAHLTAVLLDLTMPDLAGTEVMTRVRRINPSIPIIIMTGFSQSEISRRLKELEEPAAYLLKPVPLDKLLSTLEQVTSQAKQPTQW